MKPTFRIPPRLGYGLLILPLGITVLQTLVYLIAYDPRANYFLRGTTLPTVSILLLCAGILLGLAYVLLLPKNVLGTRNLPGRMASLPSAVGAVAAAVTFLLARPESSLFFGILVMLVITAVYNAMLPFANDAKRKNTVTILGFFAVFAYAMTAAYYYFDLTFEMNAPLKTLLQMGLLFSIVSTTEELRFLIGNARPRAYLMLALATSTVGALTALPVPIAFVAGIVDRVDYLAGAILVLGTTVTTLWRSVTLLEQAHKKSLAGKEEIKSI